MGRMDRLLIWAHSKWGSFLLLLLLLHALSNVWEPGKPGEVGTYRSPCGSQFSEGDDQRGGDDSSQETRLQPKDRKIIHELEMTLPTNIP